MLNPTDFDYHLPKNQIANQPLNNRDQSRLLFVDRSSQKLSDHHFFEIENYLGKNDVLVLNQTKVFPARIFGQKSTGGHFEILLAHQISQDTLEALSRPRLKSGLLLNFSSLLSAQIIDSNPDTGLITLKFNQFGTEFYQSLNQLGHTPIPPYIKNSQSEKILRQNYQTIYAKNTGSSAAPTAGLHFTKELLKKLSDRGVQIEYVTLHVGLGTFQPLRLENLKSKTLHTESYFIDPDTINRLNNAKNSGKKITAVGTTTTRCLESFAINPTATSTQLFIYPPYKFKFVDSLITNFHLPQSSLLMLVYAFCSHPNTPQKFSIFSDSLIGQAYLYAVQNDYRFFSFGDAMWII